ncbi:MAG: efflux RND transporter permease subunit [Nitrococcus sp.]|nr:efflux RND transporter permease subunit [Nitrococcus sp.]
MIERLIDFSLRNRLLMVLLAVAVAVGGAWTWTRLPVNAMPNISPVLVQVFTVTEGLAPLAVEKYVTYPVETAMLGLPGVEEIRSSSGFGLSVVSIYFEEGMDIYFARQVVSQRLEEASEKIPEGFGDPQMGPISTGMGLILYYYLADTKDQYSLIEMRTFQDWILKRQLATVPGVTEVLGIGGYEKQYQVRVDPQALLRYDLTLGEVIERIEANNITVGASFLEQGGEQFIVRSVGLAEKIKDLASIVVKSVDGSPVYLRDVAEIEIGGAIRRGLQTLNGKKEVVAGMVVKLYGANTSAVIERVEDKIDELSNALPEGVKIVPYYQQADLIEAAVETVTDALIQAVVLVVLVLLVFLGNLRASSVVALALPFSVLFAILAMGWFGISADLMSLGGLAIAIGMMVDGAVVMTENVDRHLHEANPDEPRHHVVGRACREVGQPIVFAVLIIIVVFLPLFTLQGVAGKLFRPLAYTVALAMTGSLIYAILQAPVFADLLMRRPRALRGKRPTVPQRVLARLPWVRRPAAQPAGVSGDPDHATDTGGEHKESLVVRVLLARYRPLVRFFVGHRWLAVLLAVVLLAFGGALMPRLGTQFVPTLKEGTLTVNITLAPSIALSKSKEMAMIAERQMLKVPVVEAVVTRVGRGEVGAHSDPINVLHAMVVLKPRSEWQRLGFETQTEIAAAVRAKLEDIPGMLVNMTQPIELTVDELVSGVKAELAVKLFGEDLGVLKRKADQIAAVLRDVRGAEDVQAEQITGTPQLLIRPDREAIARYGLNLGTVQQVIRAAVGGVEAGQVYRGIRRFDIFVRYKQAARATPEAIGNILIEAPDGTRVQLAQVAEIKTIVGPRRVRRENTQRYITVQANVVGRDMGSFVAAAQKTIERRVELPSGYYIDWGGQFELQQAAFARLAVVVPITVALIFLLLFFSFNSIRNALLIILNIPLAMVGGVAALWISGQALSVPASVGFIALFGVAVLNGVVLVSYLNQLLREGLSIEEASVRGACLRLRPVLMTASVAILGLIPLLFATGAGSNVQRPLAAVVVGGLVTSTILTLLVLPALYKWFATHPEPEAATSGAK